VQCERGLKQLSCHRGQHSESTPQQGCICEMLTGAGVSVWNAHSPDRERVFDAHLGGVLRHIEEYQVKVVAVTTEYTAV